MKRKNHQYIKNVKGKLGGLDIVDVTNNDFIINKAGAKVYRDLSKLSVLQIPTLSNEKQQGVLFDILSVGLMPPGIPIVTVKLEDRPIAFRLPQELSTWAQTSIGMALEGINVFPAKVEFGKLKNRYYAEIF